MAHNPEINTPVLERKSLCILRNFQELGLDSKEAAVHATCQYFQHPEHFVPDLRPLLLRHLIGLNCH